MDRDIIRGSANTAGQAPPGVVVVESEARASFGGPLIWLGKSRQTRKAVHSDSTGDYFVKLALGKEQEQYLILPRCKQSSLW
eukprot:6904689-Heterocapsa_arctica.AAC.1